MMLKMYQDHSHRRSHTETGCGPVLVHGCSLPTQPTVGSQVATVNKAAVDISAQTVVHLSGLWEFIWRANW